jgi:hypothetical protein
MGVNENSSKSVSSSITVRKAGQPSREVALASGDADGTGQPRDGGGEAARGGPTPAPPAVTV